jgi:hypothetical protein
VAHEIVEHRRQRIIGIAPRRCLSQHPPTLPEDTPLWTLQPQDGQCLIQIEAAALDRLRAMRRPSESYGDAILRLFELSRRDASA